MQLNPHSRKLKRLLLNICTMDSSVIISSFRDSIALSTLCSILPCLRIIQNSGMAPYGPK